MDGHIWHFDFSAVDSTGTLQRASITGHVDLTTELTKIKIYTAAANNFDGGVASIYTDKS